MNTEARRYYLKDIAVTWLLGTMAFTFIGCSSGEIHSLENPTTAEITAPITLIQMPDMDEYQGFATSKQIVIFGEGDFGELSEIIVHETKHLEQIHKAGGNVPYWTAYWLDPQQACIWEKEAGASAHQACDRATQQLALK
jgi:hypothetical protein